MARAVSAGGHLNAVGWATRTLRINGPLAALQPRRLSQLHTLPEFSPLPLHIELKWAEGVLAAHAPQLNAALAVRARVERLLIAGEGEEALEALDAWEREVGPSLSLIATRLAALQVTRGLEAQKEEYTRYRDGSVAQNVRFFAYWWSVRAEDGSSWRNFARDFRRRLKVWDINEGLRAHIGYQMLGRVPPPGGEALLLSAALNGSALDMYETFLSLSRAVIVEVRPDRDAFAASCIKLLRDVADPRLAKLAFLHGDLSMAGLIEPASTVIRDANLGGMPTGELRAQGIGELFGRRGEPDPASPRTSLPQRVLRAVDDLASPGGAERGRAELLKLAAMFDHLPMAGWLRDGGSAQSAEPHDGAVASQLFASSWLLEPETLGALGPEQRDALDAVGGGLPPGPSWRWRDAIDGRHWEPGSTLELASLPAAELALAVATRSGDSDAILAAARQLNEVASGVTRIGLMAEVQATLATRGLTAALELATDHLLETPDLADWLPLRRLADEIEANPPPCSNIDVPIILDFAAKTVDPRLASERTYAAEDYLLASSAARPGDLCAARTPDTSTPRERHFLGEICVPSSLRTSTMFNNERELEADRIAVCRWLVVASPDQAERFDEEARDLVRSRHIQLGVQALQGSKLSIDRTSLRRLAERSVAEDFQRYMDLLELGIFEPDETFREQVYAALEAGADTQSLSVPDNEAAALFANFTGTLMREFALHPEHGLDAYLSLRIRHGTLSGHLRGPAESEHLVTRRDASGRYLANDHWTERLGDELGVGELELVYDALQVLSRQLDNLIATCTQEVVQVRREEKPSGVLATEPAPSTIALMIAETRPGQSFDDFFLGCEATFWALIASCQPEIAARLARMRAEAERIFENAEDVVRSVAPDGAGSLKDALLRARTNVLTAVDGIGGWLAPPTTPASLVLPVEDLVRMSLSLIQNYYADFDPRVTFEMVNLPSLPGVVRLFSDMFFIIFENILKYSGNSVDPSIRVRSWVDGDQLRFCVENSVDAIAEADLARIADAKERIANGSFRRAVRGEGGTGLPKLAKVIGHGSGGGSLSFDLIDSDSKFVVNFGLRLLDVTQQGDLA